MCVCVMYKRVQELSVELFDFVGFRVCLDRHLIQQWLEKQKKERNPIAVKKDTYTFSSLHS